MERVERERDGESRERERDGERERWRDREREGWRERWRDREREGWRERERERERERRLEFKPINNESDEVFDITEHVKLLRCCRYRGRLFVDATKRVPNSVGALELKPVRHGGQVKVTRAHVWSTRYRSEVERVVRATELSAVTTSVEGKVCRVELT